MKKENIKCKYSFQELNKQEECNEKCKELGTHGHCNICGKLTNPIIECKCEFRNKQEESTNWEKEFDKKFDLDSVNGKGVLPSLQNNVKQFITSLLSKQKQEYREEVVDNDWEFEYAEFIVEFERLLKENPNEHYLAFNYGKKFIKALLLKNTAKTREEVVKKIEKMEEEDLKKLTKYINDKTGTAGNGINEVEAKTAYVKELFKDIINLLKD